MRRILLLLLALLSLSTVGACTFTTRGEVEPDGANTWRPTGESRTFVRIVRVEGTRLDFEIRREIEKEELRERETWIIASREEYDSVDGSTYAIFDVLLGKWWLQGTLGVVPATIGLIALPFESLGLLTDPEDRLESLSLLYMWPVTDLVGRTFGHGYRVHNFGPEWIDDLDHPYAFKNDYWLNLGDGLGVFVPFYPSTSGTVREREELSRQKLSDRSVFTATGARRWETADAIDAAYWRDRLAITVEGELLPWTPQRGGNAVSVDIARVLAQRTGEDIVEITVRDTRRDELLFQRSYGVRTFGVNR